jgi:hypothetical protein
MSVRKKWPVESISRGGWADMAPLRLTRPKTNLQWVCREMQWGLALRREGGRA